MATKPRKPRNVIGGTIDKQLKEAFGALPKENEMTTVPLVEGGNVQEVILDVSITATEAAVTPPSAPVTDGQPRVSRGHRGFGEYCRFLESLTAETIASNAQQLRDEEIKKAQKAALQKAFDEAKEALEKAA